MPCPAPTPWNVEAELVNPFATEAWQDFQARLFRDLELIVAGQRRLEHRMSMAPMRADAVDHRVSHPMVVQAISTRRLSGVFSPLSDAEKRRSSFRLPPGEKVGFTATVRDPSGLNTSTEMGAAHSVFSGRGELPGMGRTATKASDDSGGRPRHRDMKGIFSKDHDEGEKSFTAPTLPTDWPKALKIRPDLSKDRKDHGQMATSSLVLQVRSEFKAMETWGEHRRPWGVMVPNTRIHTFYSCVSMLMLLHDLTVGPWVLAWEVPMEGFVGMALLVTSCFWTLDMFVMFATAFVRHGGELECSRRAIAIQYLKTWFLLDLIVVAASWMGVIWDEVQGDGNGGNGSSTLKMLRFTKLGRVLRIVNLMRVFRLVKVFEEYAQRNMSEGYRLTMRITYLCINVMWVAHILACAWFALAHIEDTDTDTRWTDVAGVTVGTVPRPFSETGYLYQYVTSLHWSSAQIANGGFDVPPRNSVERLVTITCMMAGFLLGSMLVSSLSATMVDYQLMRKDRTETTRTLRQYLSQNSIDPNLCVRIQRQVEDRLSQKKRISEQDVKALTLLSKTLQSELRFEVQRPHLAKHPLFSLFMRMDSSSMAMISTDAVEIIDLRANDDLFLPGCVTETAWYLMEGQMTYIQYPNYAPVDAEESTTVSAGQWLCAAALWSEWTCVGQAEALFECNLLSLKAAEMVSVLCSNPSFQTVLKEYARQFHKRIITARPPAAPWPSDLEVPFTDYCDLVSSMDAEVQKEIGWDAIEYLKKTKAIGVQAMQNLRTEVEKGKSIVVVTGEGCVYRLASIIALRVEGDDGRFLTQIAKMEEDSGAKPSCQLPGVKQDRGELVEDTLQRFMKKKMPRLNGKVELVETFRQNVEKRSPEFGLLTRYLRTICVMRLKSDEMIDMVACELDAGNACMDEFLTQAEGPSGRFWTQALKRQVYAIVDKGTTTFYAWLSEPELEFFSTPGGEPVLRAWASLISVPANEADLDANAVQTLLNGSGLEGPELDDPMPSDDDLVGPRLV